MAVLDLHVVEAQRPCAPTRRARTRTVPSAANTPTLARPHAAQQPELFDLQDERAVADAPAQRGLDQSELRHRGQDGIPWKVSVEEA